jgi:hypothetical protein
MSRATLARERLLLEREGELAAIRAAVGQAGEGRLLVAEGPAGIGKSRLITEARAAATTAGLHVCAARGSELERAFPFGVVRQLFEQEVADPGTPLLDGVAGGARAVFAAPGEEAVAPGLDDASSRRSTSPRRPSRCIS